MEQIEKNSMLVNVNSTTSIITRNTNHLNISNKKQRTWSRQRFLKLGRRRKNDKLDLTKFKNFWSLKYTLKKMKK